MTNRTFKSGISREQASLLPPRIDDYVEPDNPVRAIDAYVGSLDLAGLGFKYAKGGGGAGQPAYAPADLLKLYLYGYLNQVRSSRRLEREARRNVEVMWLLRIGPLRFAVQGSPLIIARDTAAPSGIFHFRSMF